MTSERMDRRLLAILAADVAGYSRLVGADEEGTLAQWKAHFRELIEPKIAEHHGRIVRITGDGLLVEFVSVIVAVKCAVELQHAMGERNIGVPPENRIEFRMGIIVGDIIIDGTDMWGGRDHRLPGWAYRIRPGESGRGTTGLRLRDNLA